MRMQQLKSELYTQVRRQLTEGSRIQQRSIGRTVKDGVSGERSFQAEDQSKDPNRAQAFKEHTSQTSQNTPGTHPTFSQPWECQFLENLSLPM